MKEKGVVEFEAVALVSKDRGYASDYETNALYEVDMINSECTYITTFPNESIDGKRLHCTAVYADSQIYFIPMSGEYISIYNLKNKTISQIKVPQLEIEKEGYNKKFKFSGAYYKNGYIFIMPYTYPAILKLNVVTKEILTISDWVPSDEIFFRSKMCIDDQYIYIPNGRNNIILQFNVDTDKAKIFRVGRYNNGAACMHKIKDCFWIAPRLKGSVICWNPQSNKIICELEEYPDGFETGKIVFSELLNMGDKIYLIPAEANAALSVGDNNKISVVNPYRKDKDNTIVCMFEAEDYYYFCKINNKIQSLLHFKINKKDGSTSPYLFKAKGQAQFKKDYYDISVSQNRAMIENEKFGMNDFINLYNERR